VSEPFTRRAFFDQPQLVGARWWQESLVTHQNPITRRNALNKIVAIGVGVGAAGLLVSLVTRRSRREPPALDFDALELQKLQGWDVGHAGEAPALPGAVSVDVAGGSDWRDAMPDLATALTPKRPELAPFYVPTLFQALTPPSSAGLRNFLAPIHDGAMDAAYLRGQALADLFSDSGAPDRTAVLVDAPGPIAVAVAAGMAQRFAPVFLFDNWPHPVGVVPSQLALAATLYYRPRFLAAKADAPPVFVGDDQRLAPYTDASDRFDNRYLLHLPGAAALRGLGIERLMYVRPKNGDVELDDLNDDFVALHKDGIEVKIVALDNFQEQPQADPTAPHHYYWGGTPSSHVYFWPTYGWHVGPTPRLPPPSTPLPTRLTTGASYAPVSRPTMFSSRTLGGASGVGRQKPTGFGRVSYRVGDSSSGRSGSIGRAGHYYTGG
jgi:hypothetical protein